MAEAVVVECPWCGEEVDADKPVVCELCIEDRDRQWYSE